MVRLSGVAIAAGGLSVELGTWADLGALFLAAFALSIRLHQFQGEAGLSITDPLFGRAD